MAAREARRQLDEHRRTTEQSQSPAHALSGCSQRQSDALQQDLEVERHANEAYEHYRAHGRDTQGRRPSVAPAKPFKPPEIPAGKINTTDLDSRNVKTPRQLVTQGYNAQAPLGERRADRARRRGDRRAPRTSVTCSRC